MPKPSLSVLACGGRAVRKKFLTLCILKALSPYATRVLLDIKKELTCLLSCTAFTAKNPAASSLLSIQTFRRGHPTNTENS